MDWCGSLITLGPPSPWVSVGAALIEMFFSNPNS